MIIDRDTREEVDRVVEEALKGENALMLTSMACVAKSVLDPMLEVIFPDDRNLSIEKALYAIKRMSTMATRLHDHFGEIHHPLLLKGLLVSLVAAGVADGDEDGFRRLIAMLDQQIDVAMEKNKGIVEDAVAQAGAADVN